MPSRDDLRPTAMRKFTEAVGLVEIRTDIGPDVEYFIRRAGTQWEGVFGPMTGKFLHEFLPPEIELRWREVFDAVRLAVSPVRAAAGIRFQRKTWLQAEMFVAPLGIETVSMLLVAFVAWHTNEAA